MQPLTKEITLLREGNRLSNGATKAKELANLIKGATEACCRCEVARILAWDSSVVRMPR